MTGSKIKVTVVCTTYNHELYIRDALDGFVSQRTNFPFEVIVHDDASTDGTASIIMEYVEKYPRLIKPIFQTENNYSRGISIFEEYILPRIEGEYVALCEGDDFWINQDKLQIMADYLDMHPDCPGCCHNSVVLSVKTGRTRVLNYETCECDYLPSNIGTFNRVFYQTAGLMVRREYRERYPEFVSAIPHVGDYPLRIYLLLCGPVHYFPQVMAVYRAGVPGSWTMRQAEGSKELRIETFQSIVKMLDLANEYSSYEYDEIFRKTKILEEFNLKDYLGEYAEMLDKKYSDCFRQRTWKGRLRIRTLARFPFFKGVDAWRRAFL